MAHAGRARPGLFVLALTLAIGATMTPASAQPSLEYSVKANYLVRFAAFVDWPPGAFASAQAPLAVCVLGPDPFGALLDRAAQGQTAHGRPLAVRRVATAEAASGCHVVYVARDTGPLVAPGVLVVTDAVVSSRRGIVHFAVSQGRVRFHIDQQAAAHERLAVSSRLLDLALTVRGG